MPEENQDDIYNKQKKDPTWIIIVIFGLVLLLIFLFINYVIVPNITNRIKEFQGNMEFNISIPYETELPAETILDNDIKNEVADEKLDYQEKIVPNQDQPVSDEAIGTDKKEIKTLEINCFVNDDFEDSCSALIQGKSYISYKCVETDEGHDPYNRGTLKSYKQSSFDNYNNNDYLVFVYSDFCAADGDVVEFRCVDYQMSYGDSLCPNGCKNGACER